MSRRSTLPITFSPDSDGESQHLRYRRLYLKIRQAILNGRWPPGTRLPSSRQLAADLKLSRTTVLAAYDLLLAEGYTDGLPGSGTFVANLLPDPYFKRGPRISTAATEPGPKPGVSKRGAFAAKLQPFSRAQAAAFAPGRPDTHLFPFDLWSKLQCKYWRHATRKLAECMDPLGYLPLRTALATYLREVRALNCTNDQVIITSGAQQAHDLVGRVLLDPGDRVWCENPGYLPGRAVLAAAGAELVPVSVDDQGISVREGRTKAPDARLVSVAPSHQYPLGVVMSLARRLELLQWAATANAWIIEDDYDSEFRYGGPPLASLQGSDRDGRVIYVGTLSKVLLPSLRLGFMVVPDHAVDAFARARALTDQHPSIWLQPVLAAFIQENYLSSHLRKVTKIYQARQQALLAASSHLADLLEVRADNVGIHLVCDLGPGLSPFSDEEAAARVRSEGLETSSLSSFFFPEKGKRRNRRNGLLLGYACVTEEEMTPAVRRLAKALGELVHSHT